MIKFKMLKEESREIGEAIHPLLKATVKPFRYFIKASKDKDPGQKFIFWAIMGLPAVLLTAVLAVLLIGIGVTATLIYGLFACPLTAIGDCINGIAHAGKHRNNLVSRYSSTIEYPSARHTSHSTIRASLATAVAVEKTIPLDALSALTRDYLKSFENKASHQETIDSLRLTKDELKLFAKFFDHGLRTVMNKPVTLNGKVYDFHTLEKILASIGGDPLQITPAQGTNQEIINTLNFIKEIRQQAETAQSKPMSDRHSGCKPRLN